MGMKRPKRPTESKPGKVFQTGSSPSDTRGIDLSYSYWILNGVGSKSQSSRVQRACLSIFIYGETNKQFRARVKSVYGKTNKIRGKALSWNPRQGNQNAYKTKTCDWSKSQTNPTLTGFLMEWEAQARVRECRGHVSAFSYMVRQTNFF